MPLSVRDEIHLTCALVWTWIIRDGRCAVVRNARSDGSSWWSLPGGGVGAGESLAEAAVREAKEETGLEVRTTGLAWVGEQIEAQGRWLLAEFTVEIVGGSEDPAADPSGKVQEIRWAQPALLDELLDKRYGERLARLLAAPPDPANYSVRRRG